MKLSKSELRKKYIDKRNELSDSKIEELSMAISENIKKNFDWDNIKNIHIFLPIVEKKEVNTKYLIEFLLKKKKRLFIPKVLGEKLLCYEILPDTILVENNWGILEPEGDNNICLEEIDFDMIITPLLYCDKEGNRVGYGKGFYDRFFSEIDENILKVGVSFFVPNESIADLSQKDIPLDYLITPSGFFSFT